MPRLLEADAEFLTLNYDTLAPDKQAEAKDWLQRYKQQQADEGEPLFPAVVTRQVEQENNLRRMFEAPDKIDYDPGYTSADPLHDKMQHANMMFLVSRYQKEPAEVASRYDFLLNDYARQKLGASEDVDTAKFYALAQKDMQKVKLREDTALEGAKAALRGEDVIASLQAWQAKNLDRIPDSTEFTKGYLKAKEGAGDYLPIADELLKLMESGTGKSTRPFDSAAANRLDEIAGELATMKPRERKQVYASISARAEAAGYEQKGFWSQMLGELDKGLYRMSSTLGTQAGIASDLASNIPALLAEGMTGNRDFGMTPSEIANTDASIAKRQALGEMQSELAAIVAGEIDPVRPTLGWLNDTIETGFIKGPGAVAPFVGASAVLGPWGSGLLFTADFAEQNRRDLRAMGMDNDKAMEIGVIAAPLQAAVESLSNMVLLGRFTKLQTVLAGFTKPIGGGAGLAVRYAQNAGISLATEFTEEQLQDNFIVPAVQEIVGALAEDVPEVDWSFYKTRAAESTPELLSVLAPMALVFGGVMTGTQANLSRDMTGNIDALKALNYSEAQAVEVVSEKTEDARIAKARSLWASRAGDKVTLESGAKNLAERMRQLSGDAMAQQRELERRGKLPILRPMADGKWLMTIPSDGSAATFDSHQEADKARWTWTEDQLGKVHALTRETLASMEKNLNVGREVAVEVFPDIRTAQDAVNEGASVEQIKNRVEQGKTLGDISPDTSFEDAQAIDKATTEADGFLSSLRILGSSTNEFKDGILRTTIKLWEGANILTLVEEKLEGDAKAIIMEPKGREWMLSRLRNYEQASGDKLFRELPDEQLKNEDLVEGWSHLGQSYLVLRSTFGEPLQKKAMRRFGRLLMRSGLIGAMNAESAFFAAVASRAQKLSELKQAGKLSDDLVSELEKQLGIDSQVAHDAAATKEADAIASEAVDTSGYSPETPGPNGETFSVQQLAADFEQKGKFYRVIHGEAAFQDVVESGFVRTNASAKVDLGSSLMERLKARPTAFPSFSKDYAAMSYAQSNPNHFIIVTEDGSLQPSKSGRHSKGKTYFPTNQRGEHLSSLSADKVDIFRHVGNGIYQLVYSRGKNISHKTPEPNGETFSTSRAVPADASKVVQMPDGAQFVGPTTFSIRAYHGTPHKVDRFRLDKIGTGEGAQAYGWGLYFAENRGIGEYYQRALTDNTLYFKGRPLLKNGIMVGSLGDVELDDWFYHGSESFDPEESAQSAEADGRPDIAAKIRSLIPDITKGEPGNLYTVELLPDESEFLDWDKPLSEQSDKVDQVNRVMREITGQDEYFQGVPADMPGSWLYHRFAKSLAQHQGTTEDFSSRATLNEARAASEALARAGIPGIKYLDGNSRNDGEGTRNFVIFDENLVRILEENGKPVETFSLATRRSFLKGLASSILLSHQANAGESLNEAMKGVGTNLSPEEEVKFQAWKAKYAPMDSGSDYDLRGAFKEGITPDGERGHFPDTYKFPNHPTFSKESKYSTPEHPGGEWGERNGHTTFTPSPWMAGDADRMEELKKYFKEVEPDAELIIPDAGSTFSLRPGDFSARMEAKFSLFQAKPELRLAIAQVAKERALRLGAEWIAKGDVIRSAKDIGKEARMREALAYEARMNEYLDGLSENARQTLEFEPSALEDDLLVSAMLDFGKLMSFTTAKKSGKVESKSGDYDGQPWLPPAWFSKGAGIMPDQMAQAMHDQGLLPDAYTDTLWSELEKRIEATRKDKAAHREAVQAYKDAQKAAKADAKLEAEAWANQARKTAGSAKAQREMLKAALRTLDGILAAAPPEVRARVGGYVKLAGLATDEAMLQEIERRIDKLNVELEKWLKKEYLQRIAKLFKRFAPKKDDKGRITSNITAEAAEDIGFAFDFASLDDANQEKEMAAIEKTLEESEDAAEIQDAIGKLAIVQLFHKLEKRESSELEAAAMWIDELGSGAREARKIIDAARAEWVKEAKDAAKADASNGKLSSLPDAENVEADVRSSTFKRFTNDVKGFLNSALFTMGQQLEIVFGQDSRITTEFHRRAVRAANDSTDIKRDIEARRLAFVEKLFGTTSRIKQAGRMGALTVPTASGVMIEAGGKITTIEVPAEIVLRIIEGTADLKALGFTSKEASTLADAWADNEALPVKRQKRVFKIERRSDGKKTELTMSQDEAIQYFLWSNQKASREQMERDGWSKESFQQLNAFLSDDAKALAGFFADEYARLGRLIEPVYRRMFHAPFPRVTNYSPIFRDISSADSIIDIDQQGHGSGVSSGFILARNKNARSAMRRTSAISAFMQHAESAAHWVSHVELVRDLRSVLIDKEVQNAIRSNGRTAAANGIKKRVMQLENQGKVGAAGIAELDSWGSRLLQARAFKGLAWRISPVMKQASAYFNPLLADVPAWDYMRGTARLLRGQLDVSAMWNSPDIQRRIEMGFSAESRIAMDKLGYTGSTLLAAMGKGMLPMTLMDAGWTTAGAAIAFDYYRRNNIKSGMNEAMAENAALDQLEMMIAQSAQPADAVNRSLIEGIQNPWLKSMWMFASESRKTLAIEIMALRRLATGKSKNKALDVQRVVVAHVVMATTTQLMAGVLSLLMGDDDDREREWSVEEWAAAIAAGPINGLFLFGDAVNYVGRRLFGLHAFEPSTAIGQAVKTVSNAPGNLDKVINGEPEEQRKAFLRLGEAVGQAASLVGPGNPFTATDVILGNPLKDAEKILTRLTD